MEYKPYGVLEERVKRRTFREHCFKILYCLCFHPEDAVNEQLEGYMQLPFEKEEDAQGNIEVLHESNLSDKEMDEVQDKVKKVYASLADVDVKLIDVTHGWKLERIGKVELTILRLATYEMEYDDDVPTKVAINEAVELSKKFGGEDSKSFVNGILSKLAKKDGE